MPRNEGVLRGMNVSARVTVQRDALGVPVIRGETYEDVVFAMGFLHAQERFFQMDLSRRLAAGRLSELAGMLTAASDRRYRRFRFTHLADRVFEALPADQRQLLERYAEGVNAGLADLSALPPEYALLGATPEPWAGRDTILVQASFAIGLSGSNEAEIQRGAAAESVPPALYAFLRADGRRFESPMLAPGAQPGLPPLPGPEDVDLRLSAHPNEVIPVQQVERAAFEPQFFPATAASNNWAVAGNRTAHGGAIVAGDPHLPLTLPNTWYRVQKHWEDDRSLVGASLPGTPGIYFGSNGRVAFSFTNAYADVQDEVIVELKPGDRRQYRSANGQWRRIDVVTERIVVRGARPIELEVEVTEFGPITESDHRGRPLAKRWTAADPALVNLNILDLAHAETIDDALRIGASWYGPPQNLVAADSAGRIGWVVTGWLPDREGMDGTIPVQWRRGVGWRGPLDPALRPMLVDPPSGIIYTANNRTVGGTEGDRIGRDFPVGIRAKRIAGVLQAQEVHDELGMLTLQLDDRLELLDPYRSLLLGALRASAHPDAALMREEVQAWTGTAHASERGLVLIDAFRSEARRRLLEALLTPLPTVDPRTADGGIAREEPLLVLMEQRPAHLAPPGYDGWPDFFEQVVDRLATRLLVDERRGRRIARWGEAQRLRIAHPLSLLGVGPDPLPADPISGHRHAVRVQTPDFGASLRIAVSPGREGEGIFHMPGGQSGLWDSPNFSDGHDAWVNGAATPLLAGPVRSRFVFEP